MKARACSSTLVIHSLPHECVNALFAADWADNRRRFNRELIILYVHKTLLIGAGPRLIQMALSR
jgi:hypothetical protein